MTRREMLKRMLQLGGAAVAAILGIPALLLSLSPLRSQRQAVWRVVGDLGGFPVGSVQRAAVPLPHPPWAQTQIQQGVYVWRPTASEVVVYSRSCTDLGCPLNWDSGAGVFLCPCHGGIFAKDGARMAGPPKHPMYRYQTRIREGRLEIDLRSVPPEA
jgi:menaquinol-cytochrome c reductase iron-sulfur subunit